MQTEDRPPGAAPEAGQVPQPEGKQNTGPDGSGGSLFDKSNTGQFPKEIEKLRNENASWRTKTRALEARLAEIEKSKTAAKEADLLKSQEWEKVAGLRAKELAKAQSALETYKQKASSRFINSHVRGLLAGAGVTDPDAQATLLPGILSKVEHKIGSDFSISGDFGSTIATTLEKLGIGKAAEETAAPAPEQKRANVPGILTGQIPTSQVQTTAPKALSHLAQLQADLQAAVKGGA